MGCLCIARGASPFHVLFFAGARSGVFAFHGSIARAGEKQKGRRFPGTENYKQATPSGVWGNRTTTRNLEAHEELKARWVGMLGHFCHGKSRKHCSQSSSIGVYCIFPSCPSTQSSGILAVRRCQRFGSGSDSVRTRSRVVYSGPRLRTRNVSHRGRVRIVWK